METQSSAYMIALLISVLLVACTASVPTDPDMTGDDLPGDDTQPTQRVFTNVSASHLPTGALTGRSMDARSGDIDGDGDLDLVIATEFGQNVLLLNDGTGKFTNGTSGRLPQARHDSEDIGLADFDGDGDLDLVFVSEDDQANELYLNNGDGVFQDASDRLSTAGTSNAVLVADIDTDGDADILIGNAGPNVVLINDGQAMFTDESEERLPGLVGVTQDLELGDIDGDGDVDLIVGNEDGNHLLVNEGGGVFRDATLDELPLRGLEETREADFADVDGDGDLDLFFANVSFRSGMNAQNRLLLNDGAGTFEDATASRLPVVRQHTVDGDFADIDGDGDLDLLTANAFGGGYHALLNDGTGVFEDKTATLFPTGLAGDGIDVEVADFSGDGLPDIYFCNYQGGDLLLFGSEAERE